MHNLSTVELISVVTMLMCVVWLWRDQKKENKKIRENSIKGFSELFELRLKHASIKKELEALTPKPHAVSVAPEWLPEDLLNLRRFLQTESGFKLLQRARALESFNAIGGCKLGTPHAAGSSFGFGEALNWLENQASEKLLVSISRTTGDQVVNNPSASAGDAAALEQLFSP